MSGRSPASILYDAEGHPIGVVLDGSLYRLQTQARINQLVIASLHNNSTTPLGSNLIFEGTGEDTLGVAGIQINLLTDADCLHATDADPKEGLQLWQSQDNSHWDHPTTFPVFANKSFQTTVQATASYFKIVYKNGFKPQSFFRLQVALCPIVEALPVSLGQKPMAESLAVTLASDQPGIALGKPGHTIGQSDDGAEMLEAVDTESRGLLRQILQELKILNTHMAEISDDELGPHDTE
jgi:hypothetical protein